MIPCVRVCILEHGGHVLGLEALLPDLSHCNLTRSVVLSEGTLTGLRGVGAVHPGCYSLREGQCSCHV